MEGGADDVMGVSGDHIYMLHVSVGGGCAWWCWYWVVLGVSGYESCDTGGEPRVAFLGRILWCMSGSAVLTFM